jgi:tRNA G46 methylase TrmB
VSDSDGLRHHAEIEAHRSAFELSNNAVSGITLLEVGCGTGRIGIHFSRMEIVRTYVGIDIIPEYLAYFRRQAPHLDIRNKSFFALTAEDHFDVLCVPFTTLHMFDFNAQEVLIRKALTLHADVACFDVLLPDWAGINRRFRNVINHREYTKRFYAMPMHEYEGLAQALGTKIKTILYQKEGESGPVQHALITFYR